MRHFDYIKDYSIINTTIKGYIKSLKKEINLLKEKNNHELYNDALELIASFESLHPDLNIVCNQIKNDIKNIQPYYFKYGYYPENTSLIGQKFSRHLQEIIKMEEKLKEIAIPSWEQELTQFEEIQNGEDFIVVGHADYKNPGLGNENNQNRTQYLSCSVLSNNELNTFQNIKTVFVVGVNKDNYIASSFTDALTSDYSLPSFLTLKTIETEKKKHNIKVGYNNDSNECVTSIMTPRLVEKLSIEREIEENGTLFEYRNSQTNEVILDRGHIKVDGILLISNGCDLLIGEYLFLTNSNQSFKCINKGLYREKHGQMPYSQEEYQEFNRKLNQLDNYIEKGIIPKEILKLYYEDVVIPMNYDEKIVKIITSRFSKYITLDNVETKNR